VTSWHPHPKGNVINLSIRALILEETLLKKGFFQAIFPKLLKVLGNREPLWRGFKGKTLLQKGSPLKLMTLHPKGGYGELTRVGFFGYFYKVLVFHVIPAKAGIQSLR
jgi:hypothetical protein